MRTFLCCLLLMGALVKANPVPIVPEPAALDTPDDQDVAAGGGVAGATGADAARQGGTQTGSSYFLPPGDSTSSSSSSSEEYDSGFDLPDGGGGSVPAGTVLPGGNPVAGAGVEAGGTAVGKPVQGGAAGQGGVGVSDQNSGEVGGGLLIAGSPAKVSEIQARPNSLNKNSSPGKSAGIAFGVLGIISAAIVAIILTIRKRRDGFMRFYAQANNEL